MARPLRKALTTGARSSEFPPLGLLQRFIALNLALTEHALRRQPPLVQGSDGKFYAPGRDGGKFGDGVVYRISRNGRYTVLHNFNGKDGSYMWATRPGGLALATDGNFYGLASAGGPTGNGTIYRISPDRSFSVLYDFDGTTGSTPYSTLFQHTNGNLYGHSYAGGADGNGTFFSLNVGLTPFVRLVPATRRVGRVVGILGQGFTGATSVSFNGTPASFSVESDIYLKVTVPDGATTGPVTVTTPGGTLTSNIPFRVRPQIFSFTPTSGPVGTPVTITGGSLTQTSKVTFGWVKATDFTVNDNQHVTATVPTGAKSGHIAITTAGGKVVSKDSFTVTQK